MCGEFINGQGRTFASISILYVIATRKKKAIIIALIYLLRNFVYFTKLVIAETCRFVSKCGYFLKGGRFSLEEGT